MTWAALIALAVGTYLLKAAGPLVAGDRQLPSRLSEALGLLPPALLAALVATQTLGAGQDVTVDARFAGLAVAGLAVWRGAPFIVVVAAGTVTAALLRLLGAA